MGQNIEDLAEVRSVSSIPDLLEMLKKTKVKFGTRSLPCYLQEVPAEYRKKLAEFNDKWGTLKPANLDITNIGDSNVFIVVEGFMMDGDPINPYDFHGAITKTLQNKRLPIITPKRDIDPLDPTLIRFKDKLEAAARKLDTGPVEIGKNGVIMYASGAGEDFIRYSLAGLSIPSDVVVYPFPLNQENHVGGPDRYYMRIPGFLVENGKKVLTLFPHNSGLNVGHYFISPVPPKK